jgi:hypothetical protein
MVAQYSSAEGPASALPLPVHIAPSPLLSRALFGEPLIPPDNEMQGADESSTAANPSKTVPSPNDAEASHHRAASSGVKSENDLPALVTRIAQALISQAESGNQASPELRSALVESAAQTIFPPEQLADYDLVLPLPLQERGSPVPARLAVASRRSGNGALATWLRVDTELSRLGPVSARLAAVEHGPLIVHIVANHEAQDVLASVLPELEAALSAKGFAASVRLSVDDG